MGMVNVDERYLVIIEIEETDLEINKFEFERKDKKTGEVLLDGNGEPKKRFNVFTEGSCPSRSSVY